MWCFLDIVFLISRAHTPNDVPLAPDNISSSWPPASAALVLPPWPAGEHEMLRFPHAIPLLFSSLHLPE